MPPPTTGSPVDDDDARDPKDALVIAERMVRLTALEERVDALEDRVAVVEAALEARQQARVAPDVALLERMRDERADRSQR